MAEHNQGKAAAGGVEFSAALASLLPVFAATTDRAAIILILADTLACAIGAEGLADAGEATMTRIRRAATAISEGGASVWADGTRLSVDDAALRNAVAARALDSNDTYVGRAIIHPSDMIAALIALAEERGIGWDRLIEAVGVAYEVQCRLADVSDLSSRGFDGSTLTPLATTAGAAWLVGLSPERTATAIRIAALDAATLRAIRQGRLSDWKAVAAGRGAVKGLFALRMAEAGCYSPDSVFDGADGLFARVTGPLSITAEGDPRLSRVLLKRYPAQIFIQGLIGLAEELRPRIAGRTIERVTVSTFRMAVALVGGHGPADGRAINRESADHSAAFCVAAVLLTGGLGHEDYEALIANPDVMALMAKVELVEDPAATAAFPAALPAHMTIELTSGETLEAAQQRPAPMDAAGIATKFDALWPAGRPRAWPWRLAAAAPAFPA